MTYAATVKVFPNSVKAMFGLVPLRNVMQAVREAREDANKQRVADLTSGPYRNEVIDLVKRVGRASRPTVAQKAASGKAPEND